MCVEGITLHHYVKMADLGSFVIRVRGNGEETCFRLEKKKKKKKCQSQFFDSCFQEIKNSEQ